MANSITPSLLCRGFAGNVANVRGLAAACSLSPSLMCTPAPVYLLVYAACRGGHCDKRSPLSSQPSCLIKVNIGYTEEKAKNICPPINSQTKLPFPKLCDAVNLLLLSCALELAGDSYLDVHLLAAAATLISSVYVLSALSVCMLCAVSTHFTVGSSAVSPLHQHHHTTGITRSHPDSSSFPVPGAGPGAPTSLCGGTGDLKHD